MLRGLVTVAMLEERHDPNSRFSFIDATVNDDLIPFFNRVMVPELRIRDSTISSKVFYGLVTKVIGGNAVWEDGGPPVVVRELSITLTHVYIDADDIDLAPILDCIRWPMNIIQINRSTRVRLSRSLQSTEIPVKSLFSSAETVNLLGEEFDKFKRLERLCVHDNQVDGNYTNIIVNALPCFPSIQSVYFSGDCVTEEKLRPLLSLKFHRSLMRIGVRSAVTWKFDDICQMLEGKRQEDRNNKWALIWGLKVLQHGTRTNDLNRKLATMLWHSAANKELL